MLDVTVAVAVFPASGVWLAGRLYGAGDPFERQPGVVVTGSWLTVKEQMAGYAIELARRGYTALTSTSPDGATGAASYATSSRRSRRSPTSAQPRRVPGDDRAGMFIELDDYADPARGAVPSWPNVMAEMSWREWLTLDGPAAAARVSTPVLSVHSNGCVFPDMVRELARRVGGRVEVAWGDGTQSDFYDPEEVRFAIEAVDRHLIATMQVHEEVRA
jgi:hypothetical protein